MHDALASLREFGVEVIRHVYVLVVGVIGGILGLASAVYSDSQKPGASPLVPLWVWLPLFAIGCGVAVVWAFHDVCMQRDAVRQRAVAAETELGNTRAELARQQAQHQRALDAQQKGYEEKLAGAVADKAPPKTGLEIVIDREVPTAFPGTGLILEIEFHVTNHDPMQHALFRSMRAQSPFHFGPPGGSDDPEEARLRRYSA